MKKLFLPFMLLFVAATLQAQVNVQLHRDFGRTLNSDQESERPNVTTTVEVLHPMQVSRQSALVAHLEYNGGMQSAKSTYYGNRMQHSLVAGLGWTWHSPDYAKTYLVNVGYRQHFKDHSHEGFAGYHVNQVWKIDFSHRRFTFNGFSELWYNKTPMGKVTFLTEPQFWVNLNTLRGMDGVNLSLGTELEISNNFIYANWLYNPTLSHQKFFVNPTLAMKWTF